MSVHQLPIRSVRDQVSAEEWQTRVDLAAAYRLFAVHGWDDLIFTHITARVPGEDDRFLINPYGMLFEEITASSLVKVDRAGAVVLDNGYPVNPAGFVIHSCIHEARHEMGCVMHAHTPASIAVSAQRDGLLPLSQQSTFVLQSLAYHGYEGLAVDEDEKQRLVADLGDRVFMLLRNHGMLTVGRSVADAFLSMYVLESSCRIQLAAQSAGVELHRIPDEILTGVESRQQVVMLGMGGALAWPALIRKLDRIDPGFRD
ncbi:class II aldolase/adducin family protein [Sphingosinicella terrae]|uniref:class II aldolase/adducin family protein n=1 Tax=Sphingosinicella terrae TaxID=2172047 RepID=UPI000E0D37E1|nr:class II aldolase/adducin family protein [Sphingosinicella terrae]